MKFVGLSCIFNVLNNPVSSQAYNLEPGHEYEFRVRAKNAAGFSKPSAASSRFRVRARSGPPHAPHAPRVARVGRNYVDLTWDPPKNDGGKFIIQAIQFAKQRIFLMRIGLYSSHHVTF